MQVSFIELKIFKWVQFCISLYVYSFFVYSAKRLISANIEMPKTVELLDLSYNDITTIDDDSFKVSHQVFLF